MPVFDNVKKAIDLEKGAKAQFLTENPNKSWKGLSKADKDDLISKYANDNAIDSLIELIQKIS